MILNINNFTVNVDFEKGCISNIKLFGNEIINGTKPIFTLGIRDTEANLKTVTAFDAGRCIVNEYSALYSDFEYDIKVKVTVVGKTNSEWYIEVENNTNMLVEWVTFPELSLKPLYKNGGDAKIVTTYNEGLLCEDINKKGDTILAEYPSKGNYQMFPYMLFGQFMLYQLEDCGLYFAAHDPQRAPKGLDFYGKDSDVAMFIRLYTGANYGENYKNIFPVVLQTYEGSWHDGAEIYRNFFKNNLPSNVKKISENLELPAWYKDSPLVITYPVRGVHDMDKMDPNALFPYENALPVIDEIAEKVDSRLLVLLMHWEGTAPWAPPYVWPPYGGEKIFNLFADKLHEKNHLLGVYCSGFGYTKKSNLVKEYDNTEKIENENLKDAFCTSPQGIAEISRICTAQRSGYDICVADERGREILNEAYLPLFESNVDYCQILDQNHGGSQYFCYSKKHGHPHAPGEWMTSSMRNLLDVWNKKGAGKLFGCESAAAEPFVGNLLFSDNRFELNWRIGEPIPLYSYIYHEYLRNFMGNQVSCPLTNAKDSMCARMAYSFAAGDCITLVLTPFGKLMTNWGNHDFSVLPDKDKAIEFAANMQKFYKEKAGKFLYDGKMIKPKRYACGETIYPTSQGHNAYIPDVYSTAWEKDGECVQIFINHTSSDVNVGFEGKTLIVKAMSAMIESI